MKPTTILSLAACLSAAAIQPATAQPDTTHGARSEIAVAVGGNLTRQRDATASPLPFDGSGYQVTMAYGRTAGRLSLAVTLDGGRRRLTSAGASSVEDLTEGELRFAVRRALGPEQAPNALAVGLDVARSIDVNSHHYGDPAGTVSDFVIGAITAGPEVWWRHAVAGGAAQAQLSIPVLGFVDHPYSDERTAPSRIHARFASPSRLRGVAAALTYAPATRRAVGVEYAYRVRMVQYDDIQPVRSVSQTVSVAIVTRFGAPGSPR